MNLKLFQVSAFTDAQSRGNPAGVVPLAHWIDDGLMQEIAAENNLSETAFFVPVDGERSCWEIRWFTPAVEVPLCGHATLASSAVIHQSLGHSDWPITLRSASGPLRVDAKTDGYVLDFPANRASRVSIPKGLTAALRHEFTECYLAGNIYLALFESEQEVAELAPDFSRLAGIVEHGIIATARGDRVDFVSRFFAPAIGLDEDPVTGAAHCVLTPFWSQKLGKKKLRARQISRRGGYLECEDRGERVSLSGSARFYLEGTISVAS